MMRTRFTEERIVAVPKDAAAGDTAATRGGHGTASGFGARVPRHPGTQRRGRNGPDPSLHGQGCHAVCSQPAHGTGRGGAAAADHTCKCIP